MKQTTLNISIPTHWTDKTKIEQIESQTLVGCNSIHSIFNQLNFAADNDSETLRDDVKNLSLIGKGLIISIREISQEIINDIKAQISSDYKADIPEDELNSRKVELLETDELGTEDLANVFSQVLRNPNFPHEIYIGIAEAIENTKLPTVGTARNGLLDEMETSREYFAEIFKAYEIQ